MSKPNILTCRTCGHQWGDTTTLTLCPKCGGQSIGIHLGEGEPIKAAGRFEDVSIYEHVFEALSKWTEVDARVLAEALLEHLRKGEPKRLVIMKNLMSVER